jgi:hypothetical protein
LSRLRRLVKRPTLVLDDRGVTIIEFGIVAPVLCMLLVCAFDLGHTLYMQAVLQGIVQKAARDSTLENADTDQLALIDNKVLKQVRALNKSVTPIFTRRYYRTFADAAAAKPEPWTDTDKDGTCDHGEPYEDDNNNGVWDKDGANGGQGGAKDRTVYTVQLSYPHLFPVYNFLGGAKNVNLVATTVLENQPYADQSSYTTPVVLNCS